jgi:hypothetical protein
MKHNSTLTLLQHRLRQRGANLSAISTAAAVLCEIIDEHNSLHWHDRNRYGEEIRKLAEENKKLRERVAKLEKVEA